MNELSFHEKSTWGTLIALIVIAVLYTHAALDASSAGAMHAGTVTGLMIGYTVLLVVVLVVYHLVLALVERPVDEDERDRLIGWRAGNIGGLVLGFGVFGVIGHVLIGGMVGDARLLSPPAIANLLLLALFLATVVELSIRLYHYRRGI